MQQRTTISEIAKRLEVSNATVHRALYGKPGVSPVVASEIRRLAQEMGYCPKKVSSVMRREAGAYCGGISQTGRGQPLLLFSALGRSKRIYRRFKGVSH